ncbi:MAG: hypothetical protein IK108_09780 [Clostridia bacterium]|nr:hypothetical protein [Clostridia bacterium]
MRKLTKVLAVVLTVILALSVCTVAAFAAEKDKYDAFVIDTLLDNENFTSWKYVDINSKAMDNTMAALTAFALYDQAWKNYGTKEVNVKDAEAILLALIEKAEYNFDDGYVDEIISVLETARDVNDFIQKVNQYANIEAFSSEGWSTTFDVINGVIKVGNAYQQYREEFEQAYAVMLSIQMANAYYIDMLQYIADNTEYDVLATAAENLIAKMEASVDTVLAELAAKIAGDGAEMAADYIIKAAMNTNVYTATALKVYQVGTSIADVLWNTGDLYTLIDTVKTAYYFQSDLAKYTALALDGDDADKAAISVDMMLTARTISEQALYNYKLAENKGVITAIKNKLYKTVYNDTEMMILAVDAMRDVLAGDFAPVVGALYVYGPATVNGAKAALKSAVSEYSGETLTAAFLTDAAATVVANAEGKVTVGVLGSALKYANNVAVANGTVIAVNTSADTYTVGGETKALEDAQTEEAVTVTPGAVVDATTEVVKETVKKSSFAEWISNLFAKIGEFFAKLFKK